MTQHDDKGKIVNNLVSISLYFCLHFIVYFYGFCLFQCFRSNLEGYGRKELKRVENSQNWQKSMKRPKSQQFGRQDCQNWSTESFRGSASLHWSLVLRVQQSEKYSRISFFDSAEFGKIVKKHYAPLGYLRMKYPRIIDL